ncbi:MAG: (deoxy)nucleoside triphosphate pyrophosphohydrolase [Phycisphaerales bacterium]|nr:(deoxy)nucleoside triphosphate pyrophosphohydrolase [Phycisphaerales bacterium]
MYGGYWELPGGKLESGESPEAGVRRELREEIGIEITILRPLTAIEHTYDHAHVRLHPLLCSLAPDSPSPADLEVAAHLWCPLDQLDNYRFPEANHRLIAEVRQLLHPGPAPQ